MIQAVDAMGAVQLVLAIGTPVATVAGAYFALKYGMNGQSKDIARTREDVGEIKDGMGVLKEGQTDLRVEMGKLGTSLDDSRSWIGKVDDKLDRHIELDT